MRINVKLGTLVAAASALAIAVPAAAHPGKSDHPSQSHKCTAHNAAYIESGTVDSAMASVATPLAQNPDGTWSGTLVVDVTRANHFAKADKGTTVTYTFTNAKLNVRYAGGATGFTTGERFKLIGRLAVVGKKCAPLSPASTPVFRMLVVHPAASDSSSSQS